MRWLRHQRVPYVLVNRFSDPGLDPFVGSDDVTGARLATQHLIDLGHTRIAHLAGQSTVSTGVLRRRGYQAALTEAGLRPDPALEVEAGFVEQGGIHGVERLLGLDQPPTAVFAVTDMVAVGAYSVARRLGVRMPEDLAIVGYNDIPMASFGHAAARLLIDQIEHGSRDHTSPKRLVYTPELVVRGSTVAGADEPAVHVAARGAGE